MPFPRSIDTAIAMLFACLRPMRVTPCFCLLLAFALTSCSSHPWQIMLRDGRQFQASTKPELQRKTGYYRYQNLQGRDALLREEEVLMIEQL